jgi:hypothetical protein
VRDPRPTIMSQNVAIQRIKLVSKYAGNFCARILTDITISDILTTYDFPGQIVRIHYENLAFYPPASFVPDDVIFNTDFST